ncbi:MAG: aminopeptidase [Desulfuromonadaceae bacterium]|nr:aminopeptidase [Desulfuromonadaceae bacterium]MDD5107118.1 aminopeptidase [Desulfuromonadaceae bacterium]
MNDPRIKQFAEVLVDYSTRVKKGDVVLINAAGLEALPLVKELYALCLARGAKYVEYGFSVPEIDRLFFNGATKQQLDHFPQHKLDFYKTLTVYIGISAGNNSMVMAHARQDAMVAYSKLTRPLVDQRVKHTRWCVTRYPTYASAQEARMSLDEYEDYLFSACCIDWKAESKKQEKLKRLIDRTKTVIILAPDTDLFFSIDGLPGIKCDGRLNMPDGEVFTAPVKNSVQGHIAYNCPSIYQGKEFCGVRFEFADGKIVKATADGGMSKALGKILDADEGARYIGEFAIGVNPGIRQPMRNILFDEKIFGSIHFTPGQAYDECDNGNRSSVHWDLVKILNDGEIRFDDVLIQKNGRFVHKELLELNPTD